MRYYRRLLNISYKDHVTNEEVHRKIQAAIGEYNELLTLVKKRKLRWFGHVSRSSGLAKTILQGTVKGKRKKEKEADRRRGGKTISKSGQEWTLPAQLGQLKTGQDGKGLLRIQLWCPDDLQRLWDRIENSINCHLVVVAPLYCISDIFIQVFSHFFDRTAYLGHGCITSKFINYTFSNFRGKSLMYIKKAVALRQNLEAHQLI